MDLSERIIKYIESHHPISYSKIVQVAQGKGFSEYETSQALDKVHRNKSITTKTKGTEIWYDLITTAPPKPAPTHTTWLKNNYPWPSNFIMPFPEIDLGHLFLRTLEERNAYLAEAKGVPLHMLKKHYG